ncbi:hypothetical protein BKA61DRAFT_497309 [Leptodontidium sp. MPI-SDFR-AT-0119]|nr:hypothetical protein BKA61DRAFT_497309 [Leptodontidium sp. MPI-SDFR-AT-0119]
MSETVLGQSPPNGISVLVVGAGVGGLMTAIECSRRGCRVQIVERAKSTVTTGDSFAIGPSAIAAFRNYPEMQAENELIAYNPLMKFCDHLGNLVKGPMDFKDLLAGASVDEGKRIYRHSRPKFHAMLLAQLERMGLKVEYGHQVVEYTEGIDRGLGGVVLKDGSRIEADLVVAADGLNGASWHLIAGKPVPARGSGDAIFRVAYPVEIALKDPAIAERFPFSEDGRDMIEMWMGPDYTFSVWRNHDEMSWALSRPDPGTAKESWGNKVDHAEVLKFTATIPDWPEVADRVIMTTPMDQLVDWKLMWRDPQPKWTSPGGRVVQLGDAAHTFLPQSGNGGTQAMEDAISLATCISIAAMVKNPKESIPDATRVHNLLRFERVSCLQAFGPVNGNSKPGKAPGGGGGGKSNLLHVGKWILNYDPEKYTVENYQKALAHLKEGLPFQNTNTPPGLVYRPWTIEGLLKAHENGEPTILDGDWD